MGTSHQRETIYLSSEFKDWLKEEGMSEGTIRSYISWLTNVANEIEYKKFPNYSIFDIIKACFERGKYETANQLLSTTIAFITYLIRNPSEINRESKNLSDIRSAVKKYAIFIQEKIEEAEELSSPNEDEITEAEKGSLLTLDNNDNNDEPTGINDINFSGQKYYSKKGLTYTIDEIKRNFIFRIITQNRMSRKQNLFFPIALLKILFYNGEREVYVPKTRNKTGKYKEEFDKIIEKMINNIYLPIEKGFIQVKDINELKITENYEVLVKLKDSNYLQIYTRNESLNKIETMNARNLNDFHIDHQPLISDHLEMNIKKYNGLRELTKLIKQTNGDRKFTNNFKTIFNKVLKLKFNELKELIPDLRDDLDDISKLRLELMHSKYNLRKK